MQPGRESLEPDTRGILRGLDEDGPGDWNPQCPQRLRRLPLARTCSLDRPNPSEAEDWIDHHVQLRRGVS